MIKRLAALLLAAAVLAPPATAARTTTRTTTRAKTEPAPHTQAVVAEARWILQAQLADGAIAHHVDGVAVWPYLANYAAIGLATATEASGDRAYVDAAWRWLRWYQAHQDAQGFVTDYRLVDGVMTSTGDMDSTDAYAGTYLLAVRAAHRATRDTALLREARPGVTAAVGAIEATLDADGLTWAKPAYRVKYLMDQAETYAGLLAAAELARALRDDALGARARRDADLLRQGVAALWNPATGAFDWAVHEDGARQATDWATLYPDALQQVWAVAFGLTTAEQTSAILQRFTAAQPEWDRPLSPATVGGTSAPAGYWPVAAWAFQRAGDDARAQLAADRITEAAAVTARAWPYTPGNAGQLAALRSGRLALP